jgi:hypothetical protein
VNNHPHVDPVEAKVLARIPWETGVLSVLAALLSLLFFDPLDALMILAGGLTASFGFIWLKKMVFRLVQRELKRRLAPLFLAYGLRLLLIIGLFFTIILLFSRKVLAFTAGFSMIIPVFFIEAAGALIRMKQWKN